MIDFTFPRSWPKRVALAALAAGFVAIGVAHFTHAETFVAIMPPYLPWHLELVWISGVFEILGGLGVLPVATRRWAGYGLIALMVAVFPANLHMALHPETYVTEGLVVGDRRVVASEWGLYLRLPMQLVLIAWAWWATRPDPSPSAPPVDEPAAGA